jgi:hypothetical protein
MFKVKTGELTRWHIINAGPRNEITLILGGMIDKINNNFNGSVIKNTVPRIMRFLFHPERKNHRDNLSRRWHLF